MSGFSGWGTALAKAILRPAVRWFNIFWAKRRIKKRLESLTKDEADVLRVSLKIADGNGGYAFGRTIEGPGLDEFEADLPMLIEEGAVVPIRREDRGSRGFTQWYRFEPWFYEYLKEHPELLSPDEETENET